MAVDAGAQSAEDAALYAEAQSADGMQGKKMMADMDPQKKRALWAEYVRSLAPLNVRGPKRDAVPEEIALKMVSASEKSAWLPIWLENNKNWATVQGTEIFKRTVRHIESQVEGWKTWSQISEMYKSDDIANAIVAQKKLNPAKVRPHPECPWLESATQSHVGLEDNIENIKEKTHHQNITTAADLEARAGHVLASQFAGALSCAVPQPSPGVAVVGAIVAGVASGAVGAGAGAGVASGAGAGTGGVGGTDPAIAAEAERLRLKAEKETKRKEKQEKENKEREQTKAAFDASDAGKAKKHLNELQPLLDSAAVYQGSAKKAKCISSAMRHEWEKTFERQAAVMTNNRKLVGLVYLEKSEDASCIDKSKAAAEEFKRMRRGFDALQRAAERSN